MARKVQVSKEIILSAALNMLIRDSYSSININTLAIEIGCSTQPIVWHFGNMAGLHTALAEYALSYANDKMCPTAENAVEAFEQVGVEYVRIAKEQPNLFRFLYLDRYDGSCAKNLDFLFSDKGNDVLIERISDYYHIPKENAGRFLQSTIIFTHGIATLVATGAVDASIDEMMEMINRAADGFTMQAGVSKNKLHLF